MSYVGKWGQKENGFSPLFGPKCNSRLPRLSEIGHRTLFWPEKEGKVLKRVSQKKTFLEYVRIFNFDSPWSFLYLTGETC